MIFRNQPLFYRKSIKSLDVAMLRVTKMDKDGFFNTHMGNAAVRATMDVAQKIILEVNPLLPWAMGGRDEVVHISEVESIVEFESKVEVIPPAAPTDIDKKIAGVHRPHDPQRGLHPAGHRRLANFVGSQLAHSDLKDLGCHTEMLVDAYFHMYEAGKLTNKKKGVDKNKSAYAFAAGSQFLYDWMNMNPSLASYPVSYTNAPHVMCQHDNMVSINACVEVDLFGQVSSESSGPRHISGTGGQLDSNRRLHVQRRDVLHLLQRRLYGQEDRHYQIPDHPHAAPGLDRDRAPHAGPPIVTEFGVADLAGKSTWQRAEALINVAHPDLRDGLVKEAEQLISGARPASSRQTGNPLMNQKAPGCHSRGLF